jgi:predicted nucleotidyltransferase
MTAMIDILTDTQRRVADAFVAEQAAARHHLVVYLSGAHAYGFPSPDSDLDLKCIHVAPTAALVGLAPDEGGAEILRVIDGVEIDYGSNEVGAALRGAIKGNGNFLERILGELVIAADDARLAALRPRVQAALSRRAQRHYLGFATSQRRLAEESPTAKRVLYVLRTAATGLHLLRTGELVTDLRRLLDELDLDAARELIAIKQAGEQTPLDAAQLARWRGEMTRLMSALAAADATSVLPAEPSDDAVAAIDAWLRDVRRALW